MKTIPLSQGKFAIVDDEDFELVSNHKWTFGHGYAYRNIRVKSKYICRVYMHRLILNPRPGFVTDHINRDKLDNRRCNLRETTQGINCLNSSLRKSNKSGFTGIFKYPYSWGASIQLNGIKINLGHFKNKEDAILARKNAEDKMLSL